MRISALAPRSFSEVRRYFSTLIFSLILLFVFSSSVFAQTKTQQVNQSPSPSTSSNVPNTLHNWTQSVMIEVMSSLTCQLAGVDPINPKQSCLGADQKSGEIGFLPSPQTGGAIGFMGNMISVLYTPPLHTADYFKDLASNFGISKKTYAQTTGTGFQSLTPLIGIWSAFRNIVYLFLVIIFVAIGLAIMLRVKIDPRTVMTIQNQIPKIIIGILAVTFSFAIAGFLIDLMWVFIYLIYGIFNGIKDVNVSSLNPSAIQGQTALEVAKHIKTGGIPGITWDIGASILGVVTNLLGIGLTDLSFMNILIHALSVGAGAFVGLFTQGIKIFGTDVVIDKLIVAPFAIAGTETVLRWVIPFTIAYLIVFIALLTALFRLWFTLLMAYVQILLAVVLAPFWIIGGIVPGSPISLGGWLKDISANLLAFPVTIAMFMLGKVFMDTFGECPANLTGAALETCKANLSNHFVPPLIGNPGDPSLIGSLIGLGILLMTPNVVNMLKQMLKAPKTDMGGVMKGIGVGVGLPVSTIKGAIGLKQGSEEFIIKGYDEKSGKIDYGQRKLGRAILGRFGR